MSSALLDSALPWPTRWTGPSAGKLADFAPVLEAAAAYALVAGLACLLLLPAVAVLVAGINSFIHPPVDDLDRDQVEQRLSSKPQRRIEKSMIREQWLTVPDADGGRARTQRMRLLRAIRDAEQKGADEDGSPRVLFRVETTLSCTAACLPMIIVTPPDSD